MRIHTWLGLETEPANTGTIKEEKEEEEEDAGDISEEDRVGNDLDRRLSVSIQPTSNLSSRPPISPLLSPSNIPLISGELDHDSGTIKKVFQPSNTRYILYESLPGKNNHPASTSQHHHPPSSRNKNMLSRIHLSNLAIPTTIRRVPLKNLSHKIRYLLGCVRDKVVFIDHENWVLMDRGQGLVISPIENALIKVRGICSDFYLVKM